MAEEFQMCRSADSIKRIPRHEAETSHQLLSEQQKIADYLLEKSRLIANRKIQYLFFKKRFYYRRQMIYVYSLNFQSLAELIS